MFDVPSLCQKHNKAYRKKTEKEKKIKKIEKSKNKTRATNKQTRDFFLSSRIPPFFSGTKLYNRLTEQQQQQ